MRDIYRDVVALAQADGTLKALSGVQVYVYNAGTTNPATIYQARTGAATVGNPITTGATGAVEFYAEEGQYDIRYLDTIVPARIAETTKLWNAVDPLVEAGDLDASVAALLLPVGTILPYGGSAAPAGFLLCDGAAYARAGVYAQLFTVIGTLYGSTTGSDFKVPDMRGRVPVGPDGAAGRLSNNDALGNVGGIEQFSHSHPFNIPSHTHSGNIPSHVHGVTVSGALTGLGRGTPNGYASNSANESVAFNDHRAPLSASGTTGGPSVTGFTTGGPSATAGTTSPGNVDTRQPYQVINFMIKF